MHFSTISFISSDFINKTKPINSILLKLIILFKSFIYFFINIMKCFHIFKINVLLISFYILNFKLNCFNLIKLNFRLILKMKRIILYIATSLDGYIAKKNGNTSWLFTDQDYGYEEIYKKINSIIMGQKTYEQILTIFSEFPYKEKNCYVISRDKTKKDNENVKYIKSSIKQWLIN